MVLVDMTAQRIRLLRRVLPGAIALLLVAGLAFAVPPKQDAGTGADWEEGTATDAMGGGAATDPVGPDRTSRTEDGSAAAAVSPVQGDLSHEQGTQGAGPGAADAASGTSTATAATTKIPAGRGVRGVTDSTIQVGMTTTDSRANASAIGAVGGQEVGEAPDADEVNAAVVDYINATGGIAGRKVEPVYHFVNGPAYATAQGRQQEQQKACAAWTEDHHVFAFNSANMQEEVIMACAANSGTPTVAGGYHFYLSERRFKTMADYWYGPHSLLADTRERALGRFLVSHDFFEKGAKVGLVIEDTPDIREGIALGLKPALAQAGITPEVEVVYPDFISSPWSNYVLQMQTEGVTHIIMSATGGSLWSTLFMMRAAENQGYRPKWGIASDNAPIGLTTVGNAPPEQLANMLGMGWNPFVDIGDPTPQGPNGKTCAEVMKKANLPENSGRGQCEFLMFLRAALSLAPEVSPAGLSEGTARLRGTYSSTVTINGATGFGPDVHQGPSVVRAVRYDTTTGGFTYTTGEEPLPG